MKLSESQALNKSAAYCSKAERCESDLRKKLISWELSPDEQNRIVTRLKNEKFLDDERFCRSFVRDKIKFNKWGKTKIEFELRKKKVASTIIERCLSEVEDSSLNDSLKTILNIKIKTTKAKNDYDLWAKLMRFGLSRGFSQKQISAILKEILKTPEEY